MKKLFLIKNIQRHGTHVPILRAISHNFCIRTVVEFGCGLFSSKTFLNRKYFPYLKNLYSYEVNQKWIDKIRVVVDNDDRWAPILISKNEEDLNNHKYPEADCVFIDGEDGHRLYILENFYDMANLMIIHDSKTKTYNRMTKKKFRHYRHFTPPRGWRRSSTCVMSNYININEMKWPVRWNRDFYKWITQYNWQKEIEDAIN